MTKRIKEYWIKFLKIIFKRWIPEKQSKKEVFIGLFNWICKNRPTYFNEHCLCGCFMNHKNIDIQFNKDFVWLIYQCPKCFLHSETRYSYEMDEIEN